MGKMKLPKIKALYKKKTSFSSKKDPIWVYLRAEMKQNARRRPQNSKVLNWLVFLKDLRYHYYTEAKIKYNRLLNNVGPVWFLEFTSYQMEILKKLRSDIHADILEDVPRRVRRALSDLGVTTPIRSQTLLDAMLESVEDPGLFMWILFRKLYKSSPAYLLPRYDWDSMVLMSCLVYIDLEECMSSLDKLVAPVYPPKAPPPKTKACFYTPDVAYGEYLQRMHAPMYSTHPRSLPKPSVPTTLDTKLKFRTPEAYENLRNNIDFKGSSFENSFRARMENAIFHAGIERQTNPFRACEIEKRKQRNIKSALKERKCNYKFWEPPLPLGHGKANDELILKDKMLKHPAKPTFLKYKLPVDSIQYVIAGVAYVDNKAVYNLTTMATVKSNYLLINGGLVRYMGEYLINNCGLFSSARADNDHCDNECDCLKMWPTAVAHSKLNPCSCGKFFDLECQVPKSKSRDILFYPSTRHQPFLFDVAKIYQLDEYVEFVNKTFETALKSESTISYEMPDLQISKQPIKKLLKIFLADLADTPLMIPHLPQANLLKSLQERIRARVKGKYITPEKHKQLMMRSQRAWSDLSHIDYKAKAENVPFTVKQLTHMTWTHRTAIQKLSNMLLRNFEFRTRMYMLEHSRLLWATMMNDVYYSKVFTDAFFSYFPGRLNDTHVVRPYDPINTPTHGAKTCPLKR